MKEAAAAGQLTGIRRGENQVRIYLGMKEAEQGHRAAFFIDAAHSVSTPFPGFLRSFIRIFIRAPSGRKRFNVPGALNAVTHELITICNETYINAESVCGLPDKISESYAGIPITPVPDNARYQKYRAVFELADLLNRIAP